MLDIITETKPHLTESQKQIIADNIPLLEYKDGLFKYMHSYYKVIDICSASEKMCTSKLRKVLRKVNYVYLKHINRTELKIIKCRAISFVPYYDPWSKKDLCTDDIHNKAMNNFYSGKCHKTQRQQARTDRRTCPMCGKEFYVRPNSTRVTCGSALCVKKYSYCAQYKRQKPKPKKEYKKICKNCGLEFITTRGYKKFHCNQCYLDYHKNKRIKEDIVITCVTCGKEFITRRKARKYCCAKCRIKAQTIRRKLKQK